ncbi:hypothetical protein JW916_05085 [Candidatus Sumerlaeota bacterium]|nr:hypothetical protein [Candidatus Sumerlaeota bacterium]
MNPSDRSSLAEFLTLPEVLRFLLSRWRTIALVFFVSAAVSAVLSFFVPRTYQASSYIVVRPPRYTTELMPEAFSIQTYQQFIKNDAILEAVRLSAGLEDLRLEDVRQMVFSDVTREKYGTKVEFSPLIRLNALGKTPEQAARLADAWADELKARSNDLLDLGKGDTLAFIGKQYEDLNEKLVPAETALAQTRAQYEQRRKEIERTYETRASEFRARWNMGRFKEESDEMNRLVAEDKRNLTNVRIDLAAAREKLAVLDRRLTTQKPVVRLKKILSDDALLELAASRDAVASLSLTAEETNPVYEQISADLERMQVDVAHFEALEKALERDIEKIQTQADEVNKLHALKSREYSDIYLEKGLALEELAIEEQRELDALQRAVDKYRLTHKTLSEKAEAARMAKEEKPEVVRIASRAVAPTQPTRTSSRRFFVTSVTSVAICTAIAFMLLAQVLARMGSDPTEN